MHDSGIGYPRIAYWLNEHGYTTPRGHEFKNADKKSLREMIEIFSASFITIGLLVLDGRIVNKILKNNRNIDKL